MLLRPDAFVPERACPCCSAPSRSFGTIDFAESCNDAFEGRRMFHDSGVPISYWRCRVCCLLWTDAFDDWSIAECRERIYDPDYILADPPFVYERPARNAAMLERMLGGWLDRIEILDW